MNVVLSGSFDTAQLPRIAGDPVTVTVARTIRPGYEAEFLRWADEVVTAARQTSGCLGAGVFHPGIDGGEYQLVVRFVDGVHLREWERSELRLELMARIDHVVLSTRLQRTVGVEEWFEAAAHALPKRPWWKRLFVDVAWVYPVSLASALFIAPFINQLPVAARVLIGATIITVALQILVGPLRGRIRSRRRF
jgi:uncharacterized protein